MSTHVECNGMEIALEAELGDFAAELTCEEEATPAVFNVYLRVSAAKPAPLPTLTLKWDLPSVDLHYKWNSGCFQNRALDPAAGTQNRITSRANNGMPVYALYNLEGVNACTWALSDAVHDTTTGGSYRHGRFYQSNAVIHGEMIGIVSEYSVTLRFDFRRSP